MRRPYLGTDLDPQAYYEKCADSYANPHALGVISMLKEFASEISGKVLDFGCGSGLVTRALRGLVSGPFVGVDREARMVERYRRETDSEGLVAHFWDKLPPVDTAIASYSLHLCPHSLLNLMSARLVEAGVQRLLIISPLKRPLMIPCFRVTRDEQGTLANGKTIYGRMFVPQFD